MGPLQNKPAAIRHATVPYGLRVRSILEYSLSVGNGITAGQTIRSVCLTHKLTFRLDHSVGQVTPIGYRRNLRNGRIGEGLHGR